jgi:AcrR family transcriptional regulator
MGKKIPTLEAAPTAARSPKADRYHHGDLREALLAAAETILINEGIQGLTLRAAARAASVTHAAPAHHFGDLSGLLSELCARGYRRFVGALETAIAAAPDNPRGRLRAMGHTYIAFAQDNPAIFHLMFRDERLDFTRPALCEAIDAASQLLAGAVALRVGADSSRQLTLPVLGAVAAVWSLVHGFALLLIDGRLARLSAQLPEAANSDALLDAALACIDFGHLA